MTSFNIFKVHLYRIPMLVIRSVGVILAVVIFSQNSLLGEPMKILTETNPTGNLSGFENWIFCQKSRFSCGNYVTRLCHLGAPYFVGVYNLILYARLAILRLKIRTIFLYTVLWPRKFGRWLWHISGFLRSLLLTPFPPSKKICMCCLLYTSPSPRD